MDRIVRVVHPYPLYKETVVEFHCGCWYSSRSESFHYNCPNHREPSDPTPIGE